MYKNNTVDLPPAVEDREISPLFSKMSLYRRQAD